jgi:uncharacterized protein involved in high-affinity Fe2+ transport
VIVVILGGVAAILALNINLKGRGSDGSSAQNLATAPTGELSNAPPATEATLRQPANFREYPIGDEVEKNEMLIKAVWLPPIQMDGMEGASSSSLIHLEADVHATEGNRNGFAKDEFVPYLAIDYTLVPVDGKGTREAARTIGGKLTPMVARDGLHYGATIEAPAAGRYTLTYAIQPPSAGGLGRHVDPATGVAPWWRPFTVSFDWDFPAK